MSLITPLLYLGSAQDAQNFNFLKRINCSLIVNCAVEIDNYFPAHFEYVRLDLDDHPQQELSQILNPIANRINQAMNQHRIVFVHCAMGISRSSTIVIFTLMKRHNWTFEQAFTFVKDMHPNTNPNPGFVQQLQGRVATQQLPQQQLSQQHQQQSPQLRTGGYNEQSLKNNNRTGMSGNNGNNNSNQNVDFIGNNIQQQYTTQAYETPSDIYSSQGGMRAINDNSQPSQRKGWSQLTFDCPECELPEYAARGNGLYARIFT